ncbi:MAG: hypothetical protein JWQ30_2687 [Sediminibacterium sp.]|nr:hypothetical protein [Sediminibacterium sp.]
MQPIVQGMCQQRKKMRKTLFFISLLFCLSSKAQIQVYLSGGINNTQIRATGSPSGIQDGDNSKWQWQSGASIHFPITGDGFLYTGLQYEAKAFHEVMDICCIVYRNVMYYPKYISLPVGAGYALAIAKNMHLQFSGGIYASAGVSGTMDGNIQRNDLPISGGLYMSPYFNRKIDFDEGTDIKKWRLGLQSGISANWKKMVLRFQYQMDLSNSSPVNSYREFRYRTGSLDLGYRLFKLKK